MTEAVQAARLHAARWECDRHRAALAEALADWQGLPAPDMLALEQDSALRRLTDQILYRFTKLQDAMGERLVPATLGWLREPYEAWPMRDRLDKCDGGGLPALVAPTAHLTAVNHRLAGHSRGTAASSVRV